MKTPEKRKETQQLMAAKTSALPSSQRAAVQHLIEKCIPVLRSASRAGRGRDDPRLEARQPDAPTSKRRRVGPAQTPQSSPARPRPLPRPRRHGEKAAARLAPLARTAARAPRLHARGRSRPLRLRASRSAPRPRPGPHPPPRTEARRAQPWFRAGCSRAGEHGTGRENANNHSSTGG